MSGKTICESADQIEFVILFLLISQCSLGVIAPIIGIAFVTALIHRVESKGNTHSDIPTSESSFIILMTLVLQLGQTVSS